MYCKILDSSSDVAEDLLLEYCAVSQGGHHFKMSDTDAQAPRSFETPATLLFTQHHARNDLNCYTHLQSDEFLVFKGFNEKHALNLLRDITIPNWCVGRETYLSQAHFGI
jgi:hypothetical protein